MMAMEDSPDRGQEEEPDEHADDPEEGAGSWREGLGGRFA
jgi:hypothetical protein